MGQLQTLPLDAIVDPGHDVRGPRAPEHVQELATSIAAIGLLQPIGVIADGERFRLLFGVTRFLASRHLGRVDILCRVFSAGEVEALDAAVAENVTRRDLNAIEEARAVQHMMDGQGKTVKQIAATCGRSESWVRQRRELLTYPDDVVGHLLSGALSPSVARELVAVEHEPTRAVYLRCALDSGCTASQMRRWRQEWEASRPLAGQEPDEVVAPPMGSPPPMPSTTCSLCGELHAIPSLSFLRFCTRCIASLHAARQAPGV